MAAVEGAGFTDVATHINTGNVRFGTTVTEVVRSDPNAGAWRVEPDGRGGATETALPVRDLGPHQVETTA